MIRNILKVYFWISLLLAAFSIGALPFLVTDGTAPVLVAGWVILGHTLLIPAHGLLYEYRVPVNWLWPVCTFIVIGLSVMAILGFIRIGESIHFDRPYLDIRSFGELMINAPMFAMACLYLMRSTTLGPHKPDDQVTGR